MFAVIRTGGKQYKVAKDDLITVEKLAGDPGATVTFDSVSVLMIGEGSDAKNGPAGAAVTAEVFYVIRKHSDYAKAEELLKPHISELWAKATRLRMEITRGSWPKMKDAADVVMESGPSQSLRLEAGRAYAKSRNQSRAKEVLIALGRDANAAVAQRSEAYRLLMLVVGDELQEWRLAGELHREWVEIDPGSPEASAIA